MKAISIGVAAASFFFETAARAQSAQDIVWESPAANGSLLLNQATPLRATASSGLPVTFRVVAGPGAIEPETQTITATGLGTIIAVAEQAGSGEFAPVTISRTWNRSAFDFELLDTWPGFMRGYVRNVEAAGDLGFMPTYGGAVGGGLAILNIADPTKPAFVGGLSGANYYDVGLAGNYALLCGGGAGIEIADVSDPTEPRIVARHATQGSTVEIEIVSDRAFVGSSAGMEIFDITNARAPQRISFYPTADDCRGIFVAGTLAYLANETVGMTILDISDPAAPRLIGTYDTPGSAQEVVVRGSTAYIADRASGLQIVDVTDASRPTFLGSYDTPGTAEGLAFYGDRALIADQAQGIQVIDVSNPRAPVRTSNLPSTIGASLYPHRIKVRGSVAYVGNSSAGFTTIDLSEPVLQHLGSYQAYREALDIEIDRDNLIVSDGGHLEALDVSDPSKIRHVSEWGRISYSRTQFAAANGLAVVPYSTQVSQEVDILDVSDASTPLRIASIPLTAGRNRADPFSAIMNGEIAYIGVNNVGLEIYTLADPAVPTRLGGITSPVTNFKRMRLENHVLYGLGVNGLFMYNVADPVSPIPIGSYATPANTESFHVSGGLGFVGDYSQFEIIDASDPGAVKRKAVVSSYALGFERVRNHLFAAGRGGLRVFDLTDPSQPVLASELNDTFGGADVRVRNNIAYLARGLAGTETYQLREGIRQSISFELPETVTVGAHRMVAAADSGLPVLIIVEAGPAVANGSELAVNGPGTIILRATQEGNEQFLPASIERTIVATAPELNVERLPAGEIRIRWSGTDENVALEKSRSLGSGAEWQRVTERVEMSEDVSSVTVTAEGDLAFYRLSFHP